MSGKDWLPLNDYSNKYRISLSTLRRRIRADEVEFRFEEGKYWLLDRPIEKHLRVRGGGREVISSGSSASKSPSILDRAGEFLSNEDSSRAVSKLDFVETSRSEAGDSHELLTSAKTLLQEIKGAYVQIMKEKEEQLLQLKEEVADLRTLVKVLEAENQRLRGHEQEY